MHSKLAHRTHTFRVRFSEMVHPTLVKRLSLDERRPDAAPGDAVVVREGREKFVCIKARAGWVSFAKLHYGNKRAMTATEFSSGFIKNKGTTSFTSTEGEGL